MNLDGGIQLGDLSGIVRRRGMVMAAIVLGVMLVIYGIAMGLPNQYASYSTVLVTPQSVSPELVAAGVPESDLNNRLNLMTAQILSRGRLSRIIDDLGLYAAQSQYMVRDEIIDLMRQKVGVAPVLAELTAGRSRRADEEINQFRISFTDRDARTAMQVAQRLSNDFIEQHIDGRITLSQKSVEFIDGELSRLAERIRELEARVAELKASNPGRLPEDMAASQRRLERLMTDLAFAQRARAEATSDEAFFRSQLNNNPVSAGVVTPASRLKMLDLVIAELRGKGYTDKHPDVVKAVLEIEQLKQTIAREQEQNTTDKDRVLSFSQQSTEGERRRAALRKVSAEDEILRLQAAIDDVQAQLAETPAVAELLDGLEREYRHLFDSYQDFSNRQLEATVQAQLERRQLGEQFRVLEAAFIAPEPASPDRFLILILGAVFAVAVGAAAALVLETLDNSVHSARQLQTATGIPVLATIPNIVLGADRASLRRSRIKVALGTAALVVFAVVGGAANYVRVNGMPVNFATKTGETIDDAAADASTPAAKPGAGG
jgi:polysaccharide chain length determinant protein (PEP-CTERM system associated)